MDITVENQQKKILLQLPQIKSLISAILKREGVAEVQLAVVFVSAPKITAINRRFLKKNRATDVIAFDLTAGALSYQRRGKRIRKIAGDIFISTDAVLKQSREFGTSAAYELMLYVSHGILHLLGCDDHGDKQARRMRAEEIRLMAFLGRKISGVIG